VSSNLPPPDPRPDTASHEAPPPAAPPSPGFLRRYRVRLLWGGALFLVAGLARLAWWFFVTREAVLRASP
jgi:hypothetical protein